jgi:hypothetical protein
MLCADCALEGINLILKIHAFPDVFGCNWSGGRVGDILGADAVWAGGLRMEGGCTKTEENRRNRYDLSHRISWLGSLTYSQSA